MSKKAAKRLRRLEKSVGRINTAVKAAAARKAAGGSPGVSKAAVRAATAYQEMVTVEKAAQAARLRDRAEHVLATSTSMGARQAAQAYLEGQGLL